MRTLIYRSEEVRSDELGKALLRVLGNAGACLVDEVRPDGYERLYESSDDEEDSREARSLECEAFVYGMRRGQLVPLAEVYGLLKLALRFQDFSAFFYMPAEPGGLRTDDIGMDLRINADLIVEYRDNSYLFLSSARREILVELKNLLVGKPEITNEVWPFGVW